MKHLTQASETLVKAPEKHLKPIANISNIQTKTLANICMKHLKPFETYAYNMHILALFA
jgi:hypothetical protein